MIQKQNFINISKNIFFDIFCEQFLKVIENEVGQ